MTVNIAVPGSHKSNDNVFATTANIEAQSTLRSIAVSPTNPSMAKGLTEQFDAVGTFSDGSTQDLTSQVTWASATTSVATISDASGSQGRATAVGQGTSSISATLNSVTGSTMMTVSAPVLRSIAVTPTNPSIPKGETELFTATGTYSDGSTQDLTGSVTWASATTSVAMITAAGLATAAGEGTSDISATTDGISGTTLLTVVPPVLVSISISPDRPTLIKEATQTFTASGMLSDGTTEDLTGQVVWASATTSVATIDSGGLVTAVSPGTSTVSATLDRLSDSTSVLVIPAALSSIAVTPAGPSVPKGEPQQFTATGNFADGSTQDLTGSVTWASATTSVASITTTGLASTVSEGTSSISAALDGISGQRSPSRASERLGELAGQPAQVIVEPLVEPLADRLRDTAVERLGDPAGHAGQRIAVAPERVRQPDGLLEIPRLQERPDRLRHARLARHLEAILGADLVQRRTQIVAEGGLDVN